MAAEGPPPCTPRSPGGCPRARPTEGVLLAESTAGGLQRLWGYMGALGTKVFYYVIPFFAR
eukprot:791390-Pyramimonas_sp.AAC.1